MWSWLGKIDPNTLLLGVTLLTSVAGWIWHQIRGDKQEGIGDLAKSIAMKIVAREQWSSDTAFEAAVWQQVTKLTGMTPEKAPAVIVFAVHEAIEAALAWYMQQKLAQISDGAAKVATTLQPVPGGKS